MAEGQEDVAERKRERGDVKSVRREGTEGGENRIGLQKWSTERREKRGGNGRHLLRSSSSNQLAGVPDTVIVLSFATKEKLSVQ